MINSEKDFNDLNENIENAGTGCFCVVLGTIIILTYLMFF